MSTRTVSVAQPDFVFPDVANDSKDKAAFASSWGNKSLPKSTEILIYSIDADPW